MAEKISWTVAVSVVDGPRVQAAQSIEVDAYDKLRVPVPGNAAGSNKKVTVEVQPSAAERVSLLCISSTRYGDKLTYDVVDGQKQVALDQPHLLSGVGMVGLLGAPPQKIDFFNRLGAGKDVEVTILVGRTAAQDG